MPAASSWGGGPPGIIPPGCYFRAGAIDITANGVVILNGNGVYIFRSTGGAVTTDLANFIPRTANAGLSYAYGRYDLRFQWNYTDVFPESVDLNNPLLRNKWRGDRWQMDFTARYQQTILGPAWFIINPLINAAVFT